MEMGRSIHYLNYYIQIQHPQLIQEGRAEAQAVTRLPS